MGKVQTRGENPLRLRTDLFCVVFILFSLVLTISPWNIALMAWVKGARLDRQFRVFLVFVRAGCNGGNAPNDKLWMFVS